MRLSPTDQAVIERVRVFLAEEPEATESDVRKLLRRLVEIVAKARSESDALAERFDRAQAHIDSLNRQVVSRSSPVDNELVRSPTGKSAVSRRDAWRAYVFAFMQRGITLDEARKLAFEAVDAEEALFEPKQQRAKARALADGYTPFDKPERADG